MHGLTPRYRFRADPGGQGFLFLGYRGFFCGHRRILARIAKNKKSDGGGFRRPGTVGQTALCMLVTLRICAQFGLGIEGSGNRGHGRREARRSAGLSLAFRRGTCSRTNGPWRLAVSSAISARAMADPPEERRLARGHSPIDSHCNCETRLVPFVHGKRAGAARGNDRVRLSVRSLSRRKGTEARISGLGWKIIVPRLIWFVGSARGGVLGTLGWPTSGDASLIVVHSLRDCNPP